jgi:hypothetical protein
MSRLFLYVKIYLWLPENLFYEYIHTLSEENLEPRTFIRASQGSGYRNYTCHSCFFSVNRKENEDGPFRCCRIENVRNRTLTLIEREDDTRSWRNFLIYFSHSTTMSCPPRSWGYIVIGC